MPPTSRRRTSFTRSRWRSARTAARSPSSGSALQPARGPELSGSARQAIIDPSTIAYLGEIAPGTSSQTVGITNALDVLQVSPTDNALELSQKTPAVPGAPQNYFEQWGTYGRTFARMVPSGSEEATAQVAEMKSPGRDQRSRPARRRQRLRQGDRAMPFPVTRKRLASRSSPRSMRRSMATSTAQTPRTAAARFFNGIASMSPNARLFGPPSPLNAGHVPGFAVAGGRAKHMYVTIPGYLTKDLPAAGKSFVSGFQAAYGHAPNVQAIFGYGGRCSALLRACWRREGKNANDRTSVVKAFLGPDGTCRRCSAPIRSTAPATSAWMPSCSHGSAVASSCRSPQLRLAERKPSRH